MTHLDPQTLSRRAHAGAMRTLNQRYIQRNHYMVLGAIFSALTIVFSAATIITLLF